VVTVDAAVVTVDAAVVTLDAAVVTVDAGLEPDAGGAGLDGGFAGLDGGGVIFPGPCCEGCADLGQVCDLAACTCTRPDTDTTNRHSVADAVDLEAMMQTTWTGAAEALQGADNISFEVCTEHWPSGSAAREQVEEAVAHYNRVLGADVKFTIVEKPHRDKGDLWDSPAGTWLEFLDNNEAGTFPCHSDGSIACGDSSGVDGWVMNTCNTTENIWGVPSGFGISVNTHCYDPGKSPSLQGLLHEMGHGLGMMHSDTWEPTDRKYISVMSGELDMLSVWDQAFLRFYYPINTTDHVNLVVSNVTRVQTGTDSSGNPSFTKYIFDEDNPSQLYLDSASNRFLDCAHPGTDPTFYTAWFNTGTVHASNARVSTDAYILHRLVIEGGAEEVILDAWIAASMSKETQDHRVQAVAVSASDLVSLNYNTTYSLIHVVDPLDWYNETRETDNTLAASMILRSSLAGCN
jgi:hypothetical protein